MKSSSRYILGVCILLSLLLGITRDSHATTNDVLIEQLLQQVMVLQAQLRQLQGAAGFTFEKNLSIGDTGIDVQELQKVLNQNTVTIVAVSGAGSPGQETQLFGVRTKAAVKQFQELYRNEILTPNGLVEGTGFVGITTRAKLNQLTRGVISPALPVVPTTTPRVSRGGGGGGGGSDPTPAPQAACTITFSPPSLLAGASTDMKITTTNAVSAIMDHGVGQIVPGEVVEKTITPSETGRYALTVENSDGKSAVCSADMTVVPVFSRIGLGSVTNKQCTFPLPPALPKQTYYWFDQEYATINGESLRYDMAAPQVEGKYPLVILLHGGGFQGNGGVTKTSKFPEAEVRALAARGYVVATVEYSQATSSPSAPYGKNNFPEAIKDLRCAVQYFRSHAHPSLRFIDVGKIGVVGTSAGGHLALLLGTSADTTDFNDPDCPYNNLSARVQSVVALYPSARFRPDVLRYEWGNYKNVRTDNDSYIIFGKQSNEVIDLIRIGSPLYALENYNVVTKPYLPPMMIVNAGQERNPSLTTAVHYLVDTLRQKSVPHIFFTEYDAYHGFDPFNDYEKTSCFATSFLEKTLQN